MDSHLPSQASYRTALRVPPEHPCLPGHFPGHPLVPGVIGLEHVAEALRSWRNQRLARVPEAKFMAPWHPGEWTELELWERSGQVWFEVRREDQVAARGVIEGAA